jgi:DNA-binding LacI/PurR family transcriptional regulator
MQTTIKEIAQRLGLNPSTVSRALAGKPDVSKHTREQVIEMARQLNYTPNLWAQNLVGSASSWIGCLVLDLSNPFYVPLVRALEEVAARNGYIIFLGESQRKLQTEKDMVERFRRIKVAGVLVTPVLVDLSHLQALRDENVPVVVVGRSVSGFDSVNIDNFHSGYLVGQYLLHLGHQRVGFLYSGNPHNTPEIERLKGFKAALSEKQVDLAWETAVGNNELSGGELGAQKWLGNPHRPSAVFCSNDMLAMGFISQAIQLGVPVPEEVSVVGHDNVPFAGLFKVPLTTVSFSTDQMGRKAMEILLGRLASGNCCEDPQTVLLEPEIVIRNSCIGT